MKRSDMLKFMRKAGTTWSSDFNLQEEEFYSFLLRKMEAAGMLPPCRQSEPEYHEKTGKQLQTKTINEWDE